MSAANSRLKWGAAAFLFAASIQGFNLLRQTAGSEQPLEDELRQAAEQATSTAGFMNSLLLVFLWGGMYTLAAASVSSPEGRRTGRAVSLAFWPMLLLLGWQVASAAWSANAMKVTLNAIHVSGVALLALSAAAHYRGSAHLFVRHLSYALGLSVLINFAAIVVAPFWAISWEGRWLGLTDNANTLGAVAFSALWANVAALLIDPRGSRPMYLLITLVAALVLYGTNSVTSILSTAVALGLMLGGATLIHLLGRKMTWRLVGLVAMLTASLAVVVSALAADRLASVSGIASAMGRSGDFSGRLLQWLLALELIAQRPALGWSFDSHSRVIVETGLAYTHFHNGYLDLTVRGGLVALALLAALTVIIVRHAVRCNNPRTLVIAVPYIAATLFYNLTEVTFMQGRNLLWMLFLACAFLLVFRQPPVAAKHRRVKSHAPATPEPLVGLETQLARTREPSHS